MTSDKVAEVSLSVCYCVLCGFSMKRTRATVKTSQEENFRYRLFMEYTALCRAHN